MQTVPTHDPTRAWTPMTDDVETLWWRRFEARFNFRPGAGDADFPGIDEPVTSVTFELPDNDQWGATFAAVNAVTALAFLTALPDQPEIAALDWQHRCFLFQPAVHSATTKPQFRIPPHPDRDYSIFRPQTWSKARSGIRGNSPSACSVTASSPRWAPPCRQCCR